MSDAARAGLLTLATGSPAGWDLLCNADEFEYAALLHGLLSMYAAAVRETFTDLGILALGVALEEIAETEDRDFDPWQDRQEAARLILAFDAARDCGTENSAFRDFGAQEFNAIIARIGTSERTADVTIAIATVWRRLVPFLHTTEGLEILRRVKW
jgi:hypothetical protein